MRERGLATSSSRTRGPGPSGRDTPGPRSTPALTALRGSAFTAETDRHSTLRVTLVATELNARPRKTLGGITPAQAMQCLLFDPEEPIVATTA